MTVKNRARVGATGGVGAALAALGLVSPAVSHAWTAFCGVKAYGHEEICRLGQPNPTYVYTYDVHATQVAANSANTCTGAYAYQGGQAMGGYFPCSYGINWAYAGPFGYDGSNPSNPMVWAHNNANGTMDHL